jgi:hypothetical protein
MGLAIVMAEPLALASLILPPSPNSKMHGHCLLSPGQ